MKILKSLPLLLLFVAIAAFGKNAFNKASSPHYDGQSQIGTVIRVADGDTITAQMDNGEKLKIRLCGIDAPEKAQPLGDKSKAYLEKAALNQRVAVVAVEKDRYDRTVAEVFVLGNPEQFVNGDLVEAGLAYHYAKYSANCPNRDGITKAEAIAQHQRRGVWNGDKHQKPWEYRSAKR